MTDAGPAEPVGASGHPSPPETRRGWVSVYAVAFALLLAAGAVLVSAALGSLSSIRLLWVSAWLSVGAIIASIASLTLPRR